MIERIQAGLLVILFFSVVAGSVIGINQQNRLLAAKRAFVLGEETACQVQGASCNEEHLCCQGLTCSKQKRSLMARIFSRKSKGKCVPELRRKPKPTSALEDKSQGVSKRAHCKNLLRLKKQLSSVVKELETECQDVDFETDLTPPRSVRQKATTAPVETEPSSATEASGMEE